MESQDILYSVADWIVNKDLNIHKKRGIKVRVTNGQKISFKNYDSKFYRKTAAVPLYYLYTV